MENQYEKALEELYKEGIISEDAYVMFPDDAADKEKLEYLRSNIDKDKFNENVSHATFKLLSDYEKPITVADMSNEDLAKKAGYKNFKSFIADWNYPRNDKKDIIEFRSKMNEAFGKNNFSDLNKRMAEENLAISREEMVPWWADIFFGRMADLIRNPDKVEGDIDGTLIGALSNPVVREAAIKDYAQNVAETAFPAGSISKTAKAGKGFTKLGAQAIENAVVPTTFSAIDYASGDMSGGEAGLNSIVGTGVNLFTPKLVKRGANSIAARVGNEPLFKNVDVITPDLYEMTQKRIAKAEKYPKAGKIGRELTDLDKLNQSWDEVQNEADKHFVSVIEKIKKGNAPTIEDLEKLTPDEFAYAEDLWKSIPVKKLNPKITPSEAQKQLEKSVDLKLKRDAALRTAGGDVMSLFTNKVGSEWEKPRKSVVGMVPFLKEWDDELNQRRALIDVIEKGMTPAKPADMSPADYYDLLKEYGLL